MTASFTEGHSDPTVQPVPASVVEGEPVNLIETLAERIAQVCLKHEAVQEVEVRVHKPDAPITVPFDDVTVTITRSRS